MVSSIFGKEIRPIGAVKRQFYFRFVEVYENFLLNIYQKIYDFKIQTLEKVIGALDISVEDFFDFQFSENAVSLETLSKNISSLSNEKQQKLISSFNEIAKNMN